MNESDKETSPDEVSYPPAGDASSGRECCFCGSTGKLDREDVFPKWIGRAFAIDKPQIHWRRIDREDDYEEARFPRRPFRTKARCVCPDCNQHWMSDLEGAVKPVLRPMMLSKISLPLDRQAQTLLSFWVAKTLMTIQYTVPADQRVVPAEHYHELFVEQRAPKQLRIAIARRPKEQAWWPYRYLGIGGEWRPTPPPGPRPHQSEFNTYRALINLGHLILHLIGSHRDQPGTLIPSDLPPGFVEIWPAGRMAIWPPEPLVTTAEVEPLLTTGPRLIGRLGPGRAA